MKKLYYLYIAVGILSLVGIFLIAAFSPRLNNIIKTAGFITLGYIGIISFTYGWMKIKKK
jgi:threonine/homoserine/homoserine lactone efflux protein